MFLILILILGFFGKGILCDNNNLIIETNAGSVQGKFMEIISGKSIRAFLGIPFAEAPIGTLRFKPPVPKLKWNGIRNATVIHPHCPQLNLFVGDKIVSGEEDCLFLNVYTPKVASSKLLPVMFFIHGGGFFSGSGNTEAFGPDLLLEKEEIILVTLNYRLGALGFFATNDDLVQGNNGLKDQIFALKWVQENINKFGGDTNKITIFGESAGAASVTLLLLSPLSKDLFHAAIAQSGSVLCDWSLHTLKDQVEISKKLASLLDCPTDDNNKMLECLQKVDSNDLIMKQNMLYDWDVDPITLFRPVIEMNHLNAFISKHPKDIIRSGEAHDVPLIIGLNNEEGGIRSMYFLFKPNTLKEFDEDFDRLMKISLFMNKTFLNQEEIIKKVKKFYLKKKNMQTADHLDILNMYSDAWFTSCTDLTISLLRKRNKNPIYFYHFNFNGSFGLMKQFFKDKDYGVCHTDELPYLFPVNIIPLNYKNLTIPEKKMSEIMTTLWINFAKEKKPSAPKIEWEPIKSKQHEYLYIGNEIKMKSKIFEERIKFWRKIRRILKKMNKP